MWCVCGVFCLSQTGTFYTLSRIIRRHASETRRGSHARFYKYICALLPANMINIHVMYDPALLSLSLSRSIYIYTFIDIYNVVVI